MSNNYKDLIGLTFGVWTVTNFTESRPITARKRSQKERHYLCTCSCGKTKEYTTDRINSCIKLNHMQECQHQYDHFVNQRFGDLIVNKIEFFGRYTRAVATCSCGNIIKIQPSTLTNNRYKSCGCKQHIPKIICETYSLVETKSRSSKIKVNKSLSVYIRGARGRNLAWKLTLDLAEHLLKQNCYYCNAKPDNKLGFNGIDRLDSTIGYEPNNCVTCCKTCNVMKMKLHHDEFLSKIEEIYLYRKNVTA
jgi:hypothetical protein